MTKLYYTAPSDEVFNEIKEKAIQIWQGYDDTYVYASEKTNSIKGMQNIQDNTMYIVAMFDQDNQSKLADLLSQEARQAIRERMIDGGNPEHLILF